MTSPNARSRLDIRGERGGERTRKAWLLDVGLEVIEFDLERAGVDSGVGLVIIAISGFLTLILTSCKKLHESEKRQRPCE